MRRPKRRSGRRRLTCHRRRHRLDLENGKWIEADGNQLWYLTDWQELSDRPDYMIDQWL
jgi:hypothetical protein